MKKIKLTKKKIVLICVAAVILIAGIITTIVVVNNKKKTENANSAIQATETTTEQTIQAGGDETLETEAVPTDNIDTSDGTTADSGQPLEKVNNSGTDGQSGSANTVLNLSGKSKEDVISAFNSATAKAVSSKAGYKWSRNSSFTTPLNYSYKNQLDGLLSNLNVNVESVVGDFIDIGSSSATVAKGKTKGGDMTDNQTLCASSLTSGQVSSYAVENKGGVNTVTLNLSGCENPKRGSSASIAKVTNDFVTHEDVAAALENQDDLPASLSTSNVSITGAKIVADINENGVLTSMKISYNMEASLKLKVTILGIEGNGKAKTDISFRDFTY